MCTAGMSERISSLGRPRCTASGTAQVPDIGNKVGDTTQMQCMAAMRPGEGHLRILRTMCVRRELKPGRHP